MLERQELVNSLLRDIVGLLLCLDFVCPLFDSTLMVSIDLSYKVICTYTVIYGAFSHFVLCLLRI